MPTNNAIKEWSMSSEEDVLKTLIALSCHNSRDDRQLRRPRPGRVASADWCSALYLGNLSLHPRFGLPE